ncbi:MAG: zeta toxin [Micavibrio aeruginosavorus]|uniref:Zeta toxin n=1 Tax=Micavibrio aeruginosavorus TaxID=349221 RepID=A0A2W5N2Z0_9BACT|nr:MAG: zeta toxin [Micavibrio aeruginosavorus]
MPDPTLIIFAGANGSGKTTAAEEYLKQPDAPFTHFINTDEIARGLSPFDLDAASIPAARIFYQRFSEFIAEGKSFAIETTLSGVTHANLLKTAKQAGYFISMVYFYLPDPLLNVARVKLRVAQGGHDVAEENIKRRYKRSLYNLMNKYWDLCDIIQVYDKDNMRIAHKTSIGLSFNPENEDWKKIKEYASEYHE